MSKKNNILFKIIITAIFIALSYSLTFVSIPLPTGAKVHLGNFVLVLASLLFGGLIGGLSGSIGMMLNDIASGYPWDTFVRTLIVKFIFGLIVGILFRLLINKKKSLKIVLYSTTIIFVISFIICLILYLNANAYDKGNAIINAVIFNNKKTIKLSVLVPIFLAIISLLLIILSALSFKMDNVTLSVATVTTLGVLVNTILEFISRWIIKGIINSNFNIGLVESISKLPSNLITGVVTIIFATALFLPIYKALKDEKRFSEISNIKINESLD
jgi:uncharacterized membrane protein